MTGCLRTWRELFKIPEGGNQPFKEVPKGLRRETNKAPGSFLREPCLENPAARLAAIVCRDRFVTGPPGVLLGLVTQALLVAVQLHALAALVLRDLGFAFLFD